ncbi:MAG TPA: hypothetical protein VN420_01500, partial [Candidatus Fimivivens sp.]|nr:hypothetical protein [Candidatus Fimivivens sp.]
LSEDIKREDQVVYILSRIRKVIEINSYYSRYKYLNFYCNLALHPKIDRTESISVILQEFIDGSDNGKFIMFGHLFPELQKFIEDHSLPKMLYEDTENYYRFVNLLVDIYCDTPIEFNMQEKRRIILKKPLRTFPDSKFSISYVIE